MHGKLMCMKIKYSVVFCLAERFVDIKEMQLAFNWIRAFYDNIYPPCIVRLPNSMFCSSFQF